MNLIQIYNQKDYTKLRYSGPSWVCLTAKITKVSVNWTEYNPLVKKREKDMTSRSKVKSIVYLAAQGGNKVKLQWHLKYIGRHSLEWKKYFST